MPVPDLASPSVLTSLRSSFLSTSQESPLYLWALVTAVSFSASNVPEAVPAVFKCALAELVRTQEAAGVPPGAARDAQLALARKFREAVLQAGLLSGMARVSKREP